MGSIDLDARVEEEEGSRDSRPSTYARFQFSRMEEWKRDQIIKKQEEQNRLRRVLQEQVMEKKKREASARLREQEEGRNSRQEHVLVETPSQETIVPTDKVPVDCSLRRTSMERKSTRFSYENKDELQKAEILRKQKEQQLTRKLLADQIEEKRKRKEAERAKEKSPLRRNTTNAEIRHSESPPKQGEKETNCKRPDSPRIQQETVEVSRKTEVREEDETLFALRAQVKEQQKILREQAATMLDLREKASLAMKQRDDMLLKSDITNTTSSKKVTKPERKAYKPTRKKSIKKKSEHGFGTLRIRAVVLKRDAQDKLGIELARSPHGRCIVARSRKTFVQDERQKLRPGDLVLAIGNFKVRKLLRTAQEKGIESLHDLSEDIPKFKDVQHLFLKAGAVLKIAVCTVDMEVVEALLESDESCEDEDEVLHLQESKKEQLQRIVHPSSSDEAISSAYSTRYLLESTSQRVGREDWGNLMEVLQRGSTLDPPEDFR